MCYDPDVVDQCGYTRWGPPMYLQLLRHVFAGTWLQCVFMVDLGNLQHIRTRVRTMCFPVTNTPSMRGLHTAPRVPHRLHPRPYYPGTHTRVVEVKAVAGRTDALLPPRICLHYATALAPCVGHFVHT